MKHCFRRQGVLAYKFREVSNPQILFQQEWARVGEPAISSPRWRARIVRDLADMITLQALMNARTCGYAAAIGIGATNSTT